MNGPFGIITEWLARMEFKIDQLMSVINPNAGAKKLHFVGHQCPVCRVNVDYAVDPIHGVVIRKCDCKTGKVPTETVGIEPPRSGEANAGKRTSSSSAGTGNDSEDPD